MEALKGHSIVSVRSHVGCPLTITKVTIGHVFFSTPMNEERHNATEVEQTSSFIPIKTYTKSTK